jgi:cytochrome oxidase Cu insertion factor (SCO1/SenC/PrrC family)
LTYLHEDDDEAQAMGGGVWSCALGRRGGRLRPAERGGRREARERSEHPCGKAHRNGRPTQPDCCAIEPVAAAPSTQPAIQPSARSVGARASEWLAPADRTAFDLDHDVTDQDGQMMKLADLRGYPLAVGFVFTRCRNAQMCPAIASAMRELQMKLTEAGLAEQARLALITLDPMYDTPRRLKAYAVNRGLTAEASGGNGVSLLRPEPTQFARIMSELGVDISFTEEGEPNHKIELILIDREGRFVRDYQGAIWKTGVVMEDLKRLVAE